jgi:type II secretory pathway pseudopilin PulG
MTLLAASEIARRSKGDTLMELIFVIVILGIVATIGSLIITRGINAFFGGRDITRADWQARVALERMTRDLREVRTPTSTDITTFTATQFTYNDIFANNVSYTLSGTTLTRNTQPLADNISAVNFSYLQRDGNTTAATAAQVFYITVQLTVTSISGISVVYRDTVRPTNFP